jgi:hypothetical protein
VNRSYNILYSYGSAGWRELALGWMKYVSWQLHPSYTRLLDNKASSQVHTIRHKKLDKAQKDSREWITEIQNRLDQTVVERSSQTKFFPLEMATSNY